MIAATDEDLQDKKKKCEDLIKNSKDASPDLYTAVLNCELNVNDETFAAAADFGAGTDLSREFITGGDLALTTDLVGSGSGTGTTDGSTGSTAGTGDTGGVGDTGGSSGDTGGVGDTGGAGDTGGVGGTDGGTGGCVPAPGHPCGGPIP